ncbi:YciI family protein [Neptunicella sp. SCSIO 80796]|uniref:YciI family protein n=1 Tax=Neptunicella plasticusilytica TaxID=3117012 RepID=UPI003A4E354F
MKYLCLVYLAQEKYHACPDHKCAAYAGELQDSGHLLAAEPLHPIETATTVRVRNQKVEVTDGPFAETKEHLAGFYLIDAKDINEAIHWAAKIPPAEHGSIEVRPVRELQLSQ